MSYILYNPGGKVFKWLLMGRGLNCSLSELRARISILKFMHKSRQQKKFCLNSTNATCKAPPFRLLIEFAFRLIQFISLLLLILRVICKSNYARNLSGICENLHQFFFALTSVKRERGGHEWGCLGTIIELINHMPASNYHSPPSNGPQSVVTSKMRQVSPDGMSNGMT